MPYNPFTFMMYEQYNIITIFLETIRQCQKKFSVKDCSTKIVSENFLNFIY